MLSMKLVTIIRLEQEKENEERKYISRTKHSQMSSLVLLPCLHLMSYYSYDKQMSRVELEVQFFESSLFYHVRQFGRSSLFESSIALYVGGFIFIALLVFFILFCIWASKYLCTTSNLCPTSVPNLIMSCLSVFVV